MREQARLLVLKMPSALLLLLQLLQLRLQVSLLFRFR